jgi:hypothetical protein
MNSIDESVIRRRGSKTIMDLAKLRVCIRYLFGQCLL